MNSFVDRNVESVWRDRLIKELRPFGMTDYFYTCFYWHEDRVSTCTQKVANRISYQNQPPRYMKGMRYCSSGSRRYLSALEHFLSHDAKSFDGYHRQPSWQLELIVNPDRSLCSEQVAKQVNLMAMRSTAIYEAQSAIHPGYMGFYVLHSDLAQEEFAHQIASHGRQIEALLQTYHQRFTQESTELNPWVNTGAVPVKAQRILQMLSQGIDTHQIGEELYLSRRGIDYHLNNMRIALNAANRNHLLSKACFLEIVDSTKVMQS